jgi:hypothetical protein
MASRGCAITGSASPRRAPERELERMHDLYRERYSDFTVKHFHEQLVQRHDYKLCYTVTKLSLQAAGLVASWPPWRHATGFRRLLATVSMLKPAG